MGKKAVVSVGYNRYVVPVSKLSSVLAVLGELVPVDQRWDDKISAPIYWVSEKSDTIEVNLIDDKRIFEFEPENDD
jgi:hypothetical protein